jgi:hypothetical protein
MREQWTGLTRRAGDARGVAAHVRPARIGETLEPTLRALGTLGGALFTMWGLRALDDLLEGLGGLVQR